MTAYQFREGLIVEQYSQVPVGVTIRILKTVEEVEAARPAWEAMQTHPNTDIDFYLTIISVRKEVLRPHVVLVLDKDLPVAMAVGRVEDVCMEFRIGYKVLFTFPVRSLSLLHEGLLGDYRYSQFLLAGLLEPLRNHDVDVFQLSQIRVDYPFRKVLDQGLRPFLWESLGSPRAHWTLDLSGGFENYLGRFTAKQRYNLLRPKKMLEKDFPGEVLFTCLKGTGEVDRVCEDVERIALTTYHRGLGVGFVHNEEQTRRKRLEANRGWLRSYLLYVKGDPIAFWLCTQYGSTLHLDSTGFCSEFKRYEPGTMLFLYMLEESFKSEVVSELDFGAGDAEYKRRFGSSSWQEETFRVYSFQWRCVLLYGLQKTVGTLERMIRKSVQHFGLEARIKRLWRRRLS